MSIQPPTVAMFGPAFTITFKDYFKGSECEEEASQIDMLLRNKSFPDVLSVSYGNRGFRYFNIGTELWERVKVVLERSLAENVSPNELPQPIKEVLLHIKDKMVSTFQVHMDVPPPIVQMVMGAARQAPNFVDCFQVPPMKDGHERFAINISKK